eukprot:1956914-Rhodomonas_salina.1
MREFKSMREASAKTKVARVAIKMVCEGKGIDPDAGGFFWRGEPTPFNDGPSCGFTRVARFKGDPQLPWATRTNAQFKPVEQLSFETNEVIAEFVSVAEAKKIHGKGVSIQQPSANRPQPVPVFSGLQRRLRECRGLLLALERVSKHPSEASRRTRREGGKRVGQLTLDGKR